MLQKLQKDEDENRNSEDCTPDKIGQSKSVEEIQKKIRKFCESVKTNTFHLVAIVKLKDIVSCLVHTEVRPSIMLTMFDKSGPKDGESEDEEEQEKPDKIESFASPEELQ